jgi:hypothetical protein
MMMTYGNTSMRALLPLHLLTATLLALAANGAAAQYVWVDAKGIKQFSDRPPPPSVPTKNILKQPGPARIEAEPAAAAVEPAQPAAPTLAEREADYRKRAQEKAEAGLKAAEQARIQAARQQSCASARAYLAQLNSGERIGSVGANGERGFMGDAERAQHISNAQRVLSGCR